MGEEKKKINSNSQLRDSSSKIIFGDNILCSQFLKNYADMEILRDIKPEDLEDVTERYVHQFASARESDVVKKVNIGKYLAVNKDENPVELPLYIVSLIEHKSKVEYNVGMQILRYTIYIWEDYEKEMEKKHPGISRRKDFKYPPVLPIVYYEGTGSWTAHRDIADRIFCKELLNDYLPHFKYQMVRLHDYSNKELLDKGDEISLAMMINKIHCLEDMEVFNQIPKEQVDKIIKDTPEYLIGIMEEMMRALLYNMNLEEDEAENLVSKIKERKMGRLFEGVTFDFQAARRELEEKAAKAQEEAERAKKETERVKEEAERVKEEARAEAKTQMEEVKTKADMKLNIMKTIVKMTINGQVEDEIKRHLQEKFALSEEQAEAEYRKVAE